MTKEAETVHIVFGRSVADSLREALARLGRAERVVGLPDGLDVGSIDPPDPFLRQAWGRDVLRADPALRDGLLDDPAAVEPAWAAATASGLHPVFWACLRAPAEHACLLAFAARMGDRPFDLVDATDLAFTTRDGVRSPWFLGLMRPEDFVASGLYAMRRPVSLAERRAASDAWARLQRDDTPLRIVRDGRLVSAPLTHHDALLLGQARGKWEVAARLVGRAIGTFWDAPSGETASHVVLFGRLLALGEAGLLEVSGPGPDLRDYQVRKAPA